MTKKNMIPQGYPMWATTGDDPTVSAVIGWEITDGSQYAILADINSPGVGDAFSAEQVAGAVTFTTTDPTEPPTPAAPLTNTAARYYDLHKRLYALADELERGMPGFPPAVRLREELDK